MNKPIDLYAICNQSTYINQHTSVTASGRVRGIYHIDFQCQSTSGPLPKCSLTDPQVLLSIPHLHNITWLQLLLNCINPPGLWCRFTSYLVDFVVEIILGLSDPPWQMWQYRVFLSTKLMWWIRQQQVSSTVASYNLHPISHHTNWIIWYSDKHLHKDPLCYNYNLHPISHHPQYLY